MSIKREIIELMHEEFGIDNATVLPAIPLKFRLGASDIFHYQVCGPDGSLVGFSWVHTKKGIIGVNACAEIAQAINRGLKDTKKPIIIVEPPGWQTIAVQDQVSGSVVYVWDNGPIIPDSTTPVTLSVTKLPN